MQPFNFRTHPYLLYTVFHVLIGEANDQNTLKRPSLLSDKTGLLNWLLLAMNVTLISSGGTAKFLRAQNLAVIDVADHTGFPEMMQGRVKTLHPKIHGGILAKRDAPGHLADLEANGIAAIDLVVVNLYPFIETMESGASYDDMVENIDIGGPALIRAAAKNHDAVTILTDPKITAHSSPT